MRWRTCWRSARTANACVTLIDRLLADKRVQQSKPTAGQMAMLDRVRGGTESGKGQARRARSA